MGLEVLANALKAAINVDLNVNTGALRWQGAMTHRLEVGVGLEKKTYRWRAGPASLESARRGARSIPRGLGLGLGLGLGQEMTRKRIAV